jgi:hypothetical protein
MALQRQLHKGMGTSRAADTQPHQHQMLGQAQAEDDPSAVVPEMEGALGGGTSSVIPTEHFQVLPAECVYGLEVKCESNCHSV